MSKGYLCAGGGALVKRRGVGGSLGVTIGICLRRLDHRLADNTVNIERLSVQLISGAGFAIYLFGEEMVSVQIIIIGADDYNVIYRIIHNYEPCYHAHKFYSK